jgi:hypothetical protein
LHTSHIWRNRKKGDMKGTDRNKERNIERKKQNGIKQKK